MKIEDFLAIDLQEKFGMNFKERAERYGDIIEKVGYQNALSNPEFKKLMQMQYLSSVKGIIERIKTPNVGRHLNETCKSCNTNEIYCGYDFNSGPDDYYDFWHICMECLDVKFNHETHCYGYEEISDTDCPYCGYRWGYSGSLLNCN